MTNDPSDPHGIKHLIAERGLTQARLCEIAGFSLMTLHRIITGERELAPLERLGIESLPKTRGPKPKPKMARFVIRATRKHGDKDFQLTCSLCGYKLDATNTECLGCGATKAKPK